MLNYMKNIVLFRKVTALIDKGAQDKTINIVLFLNQSICEFESICFVLTQKCGNEKSESNVYIYVLLSWGKEYQQIS